jgi:hypothetical protein
MFSVIINRRTDKELWIMERNPNNIPTRAEMERYRKKTYHDGFFHVLFFYILPFLIVNAIIFLLVTSTPKISLTVADTDDYLTTQATLTIDSWFPTKSVTANLDGEELDLGKPHKRSYKVVITKNGLLEVNVENLNGMALSQYEHIDILDDNPPSIENAYVEDGIVTLTFTDSQSGINSESVYALNSNGDQVTPIEADRETNTFSFEMDPAGLVVHGQDRAGNEVQGTFTSHKEGDVETLDSEIEESTEE